MRWDEEKFGREYDLDVFNIVAVSDFNMGAMENKGLNIFNDKYVLARSRSAKPEIGAVLLEAGGSRNDPRRNRCGCFLPDLTGLATTTSARLPRRIWGSRAARSSRFNGDSEPCGTRGCGDGCAIWSGTPSSSASDRGAGG